MRRGSGKTMVPVADRSHKAVVHEADANCNLAKSCKNHLRTAAGQTNGRIRLKLGEPIATMRGLVLLGVATVMPHSHV